MNLGGNFCLKRYLRLDSIDNLCYSVFGLYQCRLNCFSIFIGRYKNDTVRLKMKGNQNSVIINYCRIS